MFQLDTLVRNKETGIMSGWKPYYQNDDIDMIYRAIEICNLERETLKDIDYEIMPYEVMSYRILVDDRVFAFVDATESQLNFMREHYNTNEKCKPRYTCDEYVSSKVKKKGRK